MDTVNVNEIIDSLGGTSIVAKIFGISTAAVAKWRRTGIPRARLMYLHVKYPKILKNAKQGKDE